jgi:hydroxymethylpyrimidine pyrophosphatase-like HAD family hydrolase
MVAFGDSDNDLDMLAYVGESYAMAGSPASVVAVARHQAPSNDASGVLEVLEKVLNE